MLALVSWVSTFVELGGLRQVANRPSVQTREVSCRAVGISTGVWQASARSK